MHLELPPGWKRGVLQGEVKFIELAKQKLRVSGRAYFASIQLSPARISTARGTESCTADSIID
ncbi:MAG: hypothetical protein OHK0047_24890 [Leptolyngbyaceae cyanobacterium]